MYHVVPSIAEPNKFALGLYMPNGNFQYFLTVDNLPDALALISYLNGGEKPQIKEVGRQDASYDPTLTVFKIFDRIENQDARDKLLCEIVKRQPVALRNHPDFCAAVLKATQSKTAKETEELKAVLDERNLPVPDPEAYRARISSDMFDKTLSAYTANETKEISALNCKHAATFFFGEKALGRVTYSQNNKTPLAEGEGYIYIATVEIGCNEQVYGRGKSIVEAMLDAKQRGWIIVETLQTPPPSVEVPPVTD